jgi:zinc protease
MSRAPALDLAQALAQGLALAQAFALALALALGLGALAGCAGVRAPDAPGPAAGATSADPRAEPIPTSPPVGADAVRRLRYPPLRFSMPEPERFELSNGVTVLFLRDATLPVIDVFADFAGGYTYFEREDYAAAASLLTLMRHGGTATLSPDSLDALLELNALGMHTYADGGRMVLGVRGLRRHLDRALELWSDVLLNPRFDPGAIERWRARELDAVRYAGSFPGSLAVLEFNRLLYGDHSTGWMLTAADLEPDRLDPDRLRALHAGTVCPDDVIVGASGDMTTAELRAALEEVLGGWTRCGTRLNPPEPPVLRPDPGVYIIPKAVAQSTIVVGQPGGVLLGETPDYFASRVANWVIGGGGPTSRLESRLRTREGLAYTVSSIWGVARDHERVFGAVSHTGAENTVEAVRTIVDVLDDAVREPPTAEEVALARESIANGFVFGFGSAAQIVARQVGYLSEGLPDDWMARYLDGIRQVEARHVARTVRRHIRPSRFTILIVGDTTAFDPSQLGRYTILPPR